MFNYNDYFWYLVKEFTSIYENIIDIFNSSNKLLDYLSYDEMEIKFEGGHIVFYLENCIFKNKSFFWIRIYFIDINNIYMHFGNNQKIKLHLVEDKNFNKEIISNNIFSYEDYSRYESLQVLENCEFRNKKYNQIVIDSSEILNNRITAELINYNGLNYEKIKHLHLKLVF
jgi:hypothetical protein